MIIPLESIWMDLVDNYFLNFGHIANTVIYIGLSFGLTFLALKYLDRIGLVFSYILALLSPIIMIMYLEGDGGPYGLADYDRYSTLVATIGTIISYAFILLLFAIGVGLVKNIIFLFTNPIFAIATVFLGLLWLGCGMGAFVSFIDTHSLSGFILILFLWLPLISPPTIFVEGEGKISGRGWHGGDRFHGDNGKDYWYDGHKWWPW